jgi:hypothetical protein
MASNKPGFYRSEVGYPSPTSSQNLGSKRAQYLPIMAKKTIYGHNISQNPQKLYKKPTSVKKNHRVAQRGWARALAPGLYVHA